MVQLLDLPEEVFEIIFNYLVKLAADHAQSHASHLSASIAADLRLVCRKWADWLYVHHLYHTLAFTDTSQSIEFINHITSRSQLLPRAQCQHLVAGDLWVHPPPHLRSQPGRETPTPFEILDTLVSFFSDTIVELDLEFVNVFSIPPRTIQLIGQIQNLRLLRLTLNSEWMRGNERSTITLEPNRSPHDSDSFLALLLAVPGLTSLDLTNLPPLCLPNTYTSILPQLPMITQLEIKLVEHQPLDSITKLSIALKSSLKVLSIKSFREDSSKLLPIFEHLQDSLEGLFVTHERTLVPIYSFKFPKLRVFRIYYWDDCIADFLNQDMFAYAPIQVLAVYSHTVYRRKRKFLIDPFAKLPQLRRFVFLHARLDDSPPQNYLNACKAHRVECVYLNHSDISAIMKL